MSKSGYWGNVTSSVDWCDIIWLNTLVLFQTRASLVETRPQVRGKLRRDALHRRVLEYAVQHSAVAVGCPRFHCNSAKYSKEEACALRFLGRVRPGAVRIPLVSSSPCPVLFSLEFSPSYVILMLVFLGSAAFHATLTYTGQLLDELPMIYGSLALHHAICAPQQKELGYYIVTGLGIAITVLMIVMRESPLPLQLSYGALVVTLLWRSALMSYRDKRLADTALLSSGCVSFAIAFTFWVCTLLSHSMLTLTVKTLRNVPICWLQATTCSVEPFVLSCSTAGGIS
jgi:Ceramidase